MKYDSIIFDIDGTLWDPAEAVTLGWNRGLEALNLPNRITEEEMGKAFGKPYEECLELLIPGLREKYPELIPEISRQTYKILNVRGRRIYDGVCEGIKKLSENHKLFLISNCEPDYLEIFINFSGLKDYFTGYDCHGASHISKDQMILNFTKNHSLKKVAYVGDTESDQKAAELAGADFFFVSYGFGEAKSKNPTFDNFPDLINYLNKI
jgi:phosphoglycolate phosphatase